MKLVKVVMFWEKARNPSVGKMLSPERASELSFSNGNLGSPERTSDVSFFNGN